MTKTPYHLTPGASQGNSFTDFLSDGPQPLFTTHQVAGAKISIKMSKDIQAKRNKGNYVSDPMESGTPTSRQRSSGQSMAPKPKLKSKARRRV